MVQVLEVLASEEYSEVVDAVVTRVVAEGVAAISTDADAAAGTVTTSAKNVVITEPERITEY